MNEVWLHIPSKGGRSEFYINMDRVLFTQRVGGSISFEFGESILHFPEEDNGQEVIKLLDEYRKSRRAEDED